MDIALLKNDQDVWVFQGRLDFFTVPKAWALLKPLLLSEKNIILSLAELSSVNSAALGLVIEARKWAKKHNCALEIKDVSEKLKALAKMSNVDHVL